MHLARRVCSRGASAIAAGALSLLGVQSCQFPDYDLQPSAGGEPTGGASMASSGAAGSGGGASAEGGAGAGAGSLVSCGIGRVCAPATPQGWLGPIAFWQARADSQTAPPDCPDGYGEPSDVQRGLSAPAPACSCACSVGGQVCSRAATVSIYLDLGCKTECSKPSASGCTTVSGCNGNQGTVRAERPKPSGGSCEASVTTGDVATPEWQFDARLCPVSAPEAQSCTGEGELCVATPTPPYASPLCVVRVVPEGRALPECPVEYPQGGEAWYTSFTDDRACSACTCAGPEGGSCSGTLTLNDGDACGSDFEYSLGSGCQPFALASPPARLGAAYELVPGTCDVASATKPTGSARGSGSATVICCL